MNNQCVYKPGYQGLATLPEAWATQYCSLAVGSCNGVLGAQTPAVVQKLASENGLPLCDEAPADERCVGVVANPPMMFGNHQKFEKPWGQGLTPASGLCYELSGAGGTALVAITDRCGGY